jgi:acyl-CoA reductase-like NAD-dependent aldehyde dehydrogenase
MGLERVERVLIGGEWVRAAGETYDVVDAATEEVFGQAPSCSIAQVEAAARAAREAFDRGPWPRMTGAERGECLRRATKRFAEAAPSLLDVTMKETGALRLVAETQQIGAVAPRILKYAELASRSPDSGVSPREQAGRISAGIATREPIGVVANITPFNFPMTNCAGKIAPALAVGNTVVVKPAPVNPLGVAELCRIVAAELPPGVLNFVNGPGPEVGAALVASADVDMISFTGSTEVGLRIQAEAAKRLKRTLLELGGKSPQIVFADADLDLALEGAVQVWGFHSGQICIAGTRLLVERSIYDAFTKRVAAAGAQLKVGPPTEPGVVVGPLTSKAHRERVERYIQLGVDEGATLACGGRRPPHLRKGWYLEPTLFTNATNQMTIAREEIFGPVITAIPFADEEEAVALANDSDFGLYGYVWSADTARALRVARRLRTGTVQINSGAGMHPDAPFGGYKLSGIGRDGGLHALDAYSELKYIGWTA